jgi:DNA polymerase IV
MDDKAARLRHKREMFDALSSLDASDDEFDPGREASEKAWRARDKTPAASIARPSLPRAVSDSSGMLLKKALPPSVSTRPIEPSGLHKTVSDISTTTAPIKTAAVPIKTVAVPGKASGKRKRGVELEMVPEALRVFNGLQFYFFPNSTTNPARRMRIEKAQQYGATWHQTWNKDVTHIILDNSMTLAQLYKYLKVESLPPGMFVVSENYPSECITYRSLSDPLKGRFAVKGAEAPSAMISAKIPTVIKSPELKPTGKATKKPETPLSEDEDDQPSPIDTGSHSTDRIANSFTGQVETTDELDEAIKQAKALVDITLDDDEQPDEDDANSDNEKGAELKLQKQRKNKVSRDQDKFQCMTKHTGVKADSPNLATINILEEMVNYYTQTRDEWRSRAYRQAISTLRNHDKKVSTREEALALPKIGPRLADKIEEIAFTSRLRRLDNAKAEPSDKVLQNFMGIYGAGRVHATKWVQQGYTTRDELLEKVDLTDNQRIGILHYEDFQQRIPRAEVERHGKIVRRELHKIDPLFEVIVGGSFRRGAKDSGDIDCMITRPNTGPDHIRAVVLEQLVPKLTEKDFIKYGLAITDKDDGSKWHGATCVPGSGTWRRMDLLLVPSDEIGAALIYFTGNDIFNRSLRLLASTKGMRLNQRGLYKDVMRGPQRKRLTQGTLVEGKDEKKIFEALGVPWRPPEHRIC